MQSNYKDVKTLLTIFTNLLVLLMVPVVTDAGSALAQASDTAPIDESDVMPAGRGEHRRIKRVLRERRFAADANASPSTINADGEKPLPGIGANSFTMHPGLSPGDRPMRRRNFAGSGLAGRGMGRGINQGMGGGMASAMGRNTLDLSQLNLSDEQKSRIAALRSKNKGVGKEILQSIKSKRAEMREMISDPTFSTAQIKAKRQELRSLLDDLESNKLDDLLAIRAILTPDQVKRLRPGGGGGIAAAAAKP